MSKIIKRAPRSGVAIAMVARFGGGDKVMKDRRAPKQGARNTQRDLLADYQQASDTRPTLIPSGE